MPNTNSLILDNSPARKVVVSNPSNLNGLTAMTVMFWMKSNTLLTSAGIISRFSSDASQNQFSIFIDGADSTKLGVVIATTITDNFGNFALTPTGQLGTGSWDHWAIVFDGSLSGNANRLKIYKNGSQIGSLTFNGTIPAALTSPTQDMQWGTREANFNRPDCLLDEPAIFNAALSGATITDYMQKDLTGFANLLHYWKNNDGSGTTTTAVTGTNGTLDNADQWSIDVPFANYSNAEGFLRRILMNQSVKRASFYCLAFLIPYLLL